MYVNITSFIYITFILLLHNVHSSGGGTCNPGGQGCADESLRAMLNHVLGNHLICVLGHFLLQITHWIVLNLGQDALLEGLDFEPCPGKMTYS